MAYGRVNADFPETYRNNATRPERVSDHDPVIGYLTLPAYVAPTDVTSQTTALGSGLTYNRATQLYSGTITVTNKGAQTIAGPIDVLLTNLSAGVTLTNAAGTSSGSPYITTAGPLAPGASVTLAVQFTATGNARIGYTSKVYFRSFFKMIKSAAFLFVASSGLLATTFTYNVAVNTSSLSATAGTIDFQFNPGDSTSDLATALISNFTITGPGSLSGVPMYFGDSSGVLPSSLRVSNTFNDNEALQALNFGTALAFRVTINETLTGTPMREAYLTSACSSPMASHRYLQQIPTASWPAST